MFLLQVSRSLLPMHPNLFGMHGGDPNPVVFRPPGYLLYPLPKLLCRVAGMWPTCSTCKRERHLSNTQPAPRSPCRGSSSGYLNWSSRVLHSRASDAGHTESLTACTKSLGLAQTLTHSDLLSLSPNALVLIFNATLLQRLQFSPMVADCSGLLEVESELQYPSWGMQLSLLAASPPFRVPAPGSAPKPNCHGPQGWPFSSKSPGSLGLA